MGFGAWAGWGKGPWPMMAMAMAPDFVRPRVQPAEADWPGHLLVIWKIDKRNRQTVQNL